MAVRQDTIWERFLSPVVRFLIDEEKLKRYAESIDWETESDVQGQAASLRDAPRTRPRIRRADVTIPAYYSSQNFHGIKGGYLNHRAALTYDPITEYVLPPNETVVRQALINAVKAPHSRFRLRYRFYNSDVKASFPAGVKPILVTDATAQIKVRQYTTGSTDSTIDNNDLEGLISPVFGITA